ncbi:uncharacterized protein LOC111638334 [Centruroides sculpturatus]|uniref:uncharacterized protein LOC111638334 n=1 Tax=Centruroides sculpturatus TaxID=218467 RepID=UPI000C6DEB62|nr:uncharacterized protein LOC111638334 [Centruroides sculpturatus]
MPTLQDEYNVENKENCLLSGINLESLNIFFKYKEYLLPFVEKSFENISKEHRNLENVAKLMEDLLSTITYYHKIIVDLSLVGVFHENSLKDSILEVKFVNGNRRTLFLLKFSLNPETHLELPIIPHYLHLRGVNFREEIVKVCESVLPGENYLSRTICAVEDFLTRIQNTV